jgi:hypothetical protein
MACSRKAAAVLVCLLMAGCSDIGWKKPGAASADFDRDADECERMSETSIFRGSRGTNTPASLQGFEDRCMAAHGWKNARWPGS